MRFLHATALALALSLTAFAAPPVVPPVIEGKAGKPLLFDVKLESGKKIGWSRGFDKNKCVVVRLHSDDSTVMSFMAIPDKDGEYYLTFWTEGEITSSQTVLQVGKAPDPPPPTDPPVDPPGTGPFYFLIIRPDGPADPAFTKVMADPAWADLIKNGHLYKAKTVTEAADPDGINLRLPPGTVLPAVVTLKVSAGRSTIVRDAIPLPIASDNIRKLPEGVR